jgi:hypothetical protein
VFEYGDEGFNQADPKEEVLFFGPDKFLWCCSLCAAKGMLGRFGVGGVFRFMKSPIRIFRSGKKYEDPDARAAEVIVPRASLFGGCQTLHSSGTRDSQLAMMRNAAQPRMTRQPLIIQFATVESTVRPIPALNPTQLFSYHGSQRTLRFGSYDEINCSLLCTD